MVYPGRKVHDVLPQFAGTNVIKPTAEQRTELLAFVAKEYPAGRSLRRADRANLVGDTASARPDQYPAAWTRRAGDQRQMTAYLASYHTQARW